MHRDDYQIDQSISFGEDQTVNLRSANLDHNNKSNIEADTPQGELMRWHY